MHQKYNALKVISSIYRQSVPASLPVVLYCNKISKHINPSRSKFSILRAVTQDVRQSIASIESELYSLHLHLSNSIPNFSSFEKRNYANVDFQSARHETILD